MKVTLNDRGIVMTDTKELGVSHYGISAVARLTGITVHTLRMWEKRYSALKTKRSPAGRRNYTQGNISRLNLLKYLVDRGIAISGIAKLSNAELKERIEDFESNYSQRKRNILPKKFRIAVYGDFLTLQLNKQKAEFVQLDVILSASNMNQFKSDISRLKPEVLLLELPIIDSNTTKLILELQRMSGASRIIITYSYARDMDISKLSDGITIPMRSPVPIAELNDILVNKYEEIAQERKTPIIIDESDLPQEFVAPPRLFNTTELSRLAAQSKTIECECPRHIVDLILGLSHFEDYSSICVNRSPEDAVLHAYLQSTTARARYMMEEALKKIADVENLLPKK